MKYRLLLLVFMFNSLFTLLAENMSIRIPFTKDSKDTRLGYFVGLIDMAMKYTADEYGDYTLIYSDNEMVQERAFAKLKSNKGIDLYWGMTSIQREESFAPIRIPLIKGLLGHRICIIRKKDGEKFSDITTLSQLKQMVLVQGADWPDTQILEFNGFNVHKMSVYENMFKMVSSGRVDFFPRGVNEPYEEVRIRPELNLVVDNKLLIKYIAPMYFFVNKQNKILEERLNKGLIRAIESGEFDEYFYNHPTTRAITELAKIEERVIFEIDNPILPPLTPIDDKRLWYKP